MLERWNPDTDRFIKRNRRNYSQSVLDLWAISNFFNCGEYLLTSLSFRHFVQKERGIRKLFFCAPRSWYSENDPIYPLLNI